MKSALVIGVVGLAMMASEASANLVVNGGFKSFATGGVDHFLGDGPNNTPGATTLVGWSYVGLGNPANANGAAVWVSGPGDADTIGATRSDGFSAALWGPGTGVANGLTATSPAGGNFMVADAVAQYSFPISQSISGLLVGRSYTLDFDWAAAQWDCCIRATTAGWIVTFGSQTNATTVVNNVGQGFVPWMAESFAFTATSSTQTLTFLATGGPTGQPPVALLDGVSLSLVPEPGAWVLMLAGVAGLGAMARRRRAAALLAI